MVRFRNTWEAVRDPVRASRWRWLSFAWVFAVFEILLGGALAIGGSRLVVAKGAFALYAHVYVVDWGLHLHGVMLFILGLWLVIGLSGPALGYPEPQRSLQRGLVCSWAYLLWSVVLFAMAPVEPSGDFSYVAVLTFFTLSLWPAILSISPPPMLIPRDETDLIRAAVEVGIEQGRAVALAHRIARRRTAHDRR